MKTFAIVPSKMFANAKTRLSAVLGSEDRIRLSSLMLQDTLSVLSSVRSLQQIIVVSADRRAEELTTKSNAKFLYQRNDSGVNSAVMVADKYCIDHGADATIVIPQDLPLLNAIDIERVCCLAENEKQCVVICPSLRYDGTNLLLRKPPCVMRTFYDRDSYITHVHAACGQDIVVKLFVSKKIMTDIDTPEDMRQLASQSGLNGTTKFIKSLLCRS